MAYLGKLLQVILTRHAQLMLAKYEPRCIGVTGSVGKSSTKQAIARVLATKYTVGWDPKSYNTEIGLPLAIIGESAQGRNIFGWLGVLARSAARVLARDASYPQVLVLEFGVDAPGNMAYLTGVVSPQVGVVTLIAPTHLEGLGSIEVVQAEKMSLLHALSGEKQCAIVNADDSRQTEDVAVMRPQAPVLSFGQATSADVRLVRADFARSFNPDQGVATLGVRAVVSYRGEEAVLEVSGIIGVHQLTPLLAAITVGVAEGVELHDAARALQDYVVPQGRMRLLSGIKQTLIIDDSYNSSPVAAVAALVTLMSIDVVGGARRIALLGDMRELGDMTESAHRDLGRMVAESGLDLLLTVGVNGDIVREAAVARGMDKSKIFCFNDAQTAGVKLQELIRSGDVILVKGSQNTIRLERAVKEIMAEPERACELLVRQGKEWQ